MTELKGSPLPCLATLSQLSKLQWRGVTMHQPAKPSGKRCDWKIMRAIPHEEIKVLKRDIDKGVADIAAGRLTEFDADHIVERRRKRLATRKPSA